ncbi:MAG TPA: pyridoxal-phosphate dependent enzyme [Chitinispirillaceae bacterium]|nr:pyridoxal-phosphate dependent enzyme [Chitinispirillaceae bacterium]
MITLFKKYPLLAASLNYQKLGHFPTPVSKLENLGKELRNNNLFIKRDDLSSNLYGGNKIRKLEFIFGDVIAAGYKQVLTSGAAGSNHALATALFGAQAGLKVILMLFEQSYNPEIKKNLLADYLSGAQIYLDSSYEAHLLSLNRVINEQGSDNIYVIPPGGSSVSGVCGYVNATFELKEQIKRGEIPEPKAIFVAMGTMGTAVGLMLGLKAAGLKSKLIAVQVVPSYISDYDKFMSLFESANKFLHDKDPQFPIFKIGEEELCLEPAFLGPGYGYITAQAESAIELLLRTESIKLDGVYTGKAFAAFLQECSKNEHQSTLLFWNTKNSVALPEPGNGFDYRNLPSPCHQYFKDD